MMDGACIPNGWTLATLQDVAEIRDDLRQPVNAEERAGRAGPYPYFGATGQVGWIDDFLMEGEYVLLGEDGSISRSEPAQSISGIREMLGK